MLIHKAMASVVKDIGAVGKDNVNKHQKWNFRSIDDTASAVNPMLGKHGIYVRIKTIWRKKEEKLTGNQVLTKTDMKVRYTFVATDGSTSSSTIEGTSWDYSDKGTTQVYSIIYKTLLAQVFCIPYSDSDDPDKKSLKDESGKVNKPAKKKKPTGKPAKMSEEQITFITKLQKSSALTDEDKKKITTWLEKDHSVEAGINMINALQEKIKAGKDKKEDAPEEEVPKWILDHRELMDALLERAALVIPKKVCQNYYDKAQNDGLKVQAATRSINTLKKLIHDHVMNGLQTSYKEGENPYDDPAKFFTKVMKGEFMVEIENIEPMEFADILEKIKNRDYPPF